MSRYSKKRQARQRAITKSLVARGFDPVISASEKIHERADELSGLKMFDEVDKFAGENKPGEMSYDYSSAAHECGVALGEEAHIPQFGYHEAQSQWQYVIDDWTKA